MELSHKLLQLSDGSSECFWYFRYIFLILTVERIQYRLIPPLTSVKDAMQTTAVEEEISTTSVLADCCHHAGPACFFYTVCINTSLQFALFSNLIYGRRRKGGGTFSQTK